jgi:hypothetical protein
VFKAAGWVEGQAQPWLLVTSLAATRARVAEDAQRWAIARFFLSWKRPGWELEGDRQLSIAQHLDNVRGHAGVHVLADRPGFLQRAQRFKHNRTGLDRCKEIVPLAQIAADDARVASHQGGDQRAAVDRGDACHGRVQNRLLSFVAFSHEPSAPPRSEHVEQMSSVGSLYETEYPLSRNDMAPSLTDELLPAS